MTLFCSIAGRPCCQLCWATYQPAHRPTRWYTTAREYGPESSDNSITVSSAICGDINNDHHLAIICPMFEPKVHSHLHLNSHWSKRLSNSIITSGHSLCQRWLVVGAEGCRTLGKCLTKCGRSKPHTTSVLQSLGLPVGHRCASAALQWYSQNAEWIRVNNKWIRQSILTSSVEQI